MRLQVKTAINGYNYFFVTTKGIKKRQTLLAILNPRSILPREILFSKSTPLLLFVVLTSQKMSQSFRLEST